VPAISATWLVGSVEGLAAQSISVDGAAAVEVTSAGSWYLRHSVDALSMLAQVQAVLVAELGDGSAVVRRDRLVELSSTSSFALSWASAPDLAALLGFGPGALASSTSHVALAPSPLVFSAGWPATMPTGTGQASYPVEDEHTQISAAGDIVDSEFYNVQEHQDFQFSQVAAARVRTTDATSTVLQGGTWHRFRERVLRPNARFQAYEYVTEDASSSSAVTWPAALGTYKRRTLPRGRYDRDIANANTRWSLGVEAIVQPEYAPNA